MTSSSSTLPPVGQCLRILGAYTFVAGLGLIVMGPFQAVMNAASTCQDDQTPATLIVDPQGQTTSACTIAMSALE